MQAHLEALPQLTSSTSAVTSVLISGYRFDLLAPYRVGQQISAAEAQALNQLRAERVQSNVRAIVQRAVAVLASGQLLSAGQVEAVQSQISSYDEKFTFVERHESKPKLSAIDREVEEIALAQAKMAFKRLAPATATAEQFEQLVANYRKASWIQEEARRRVGAKRAQVVGTPEELL